MNKAITVVLAAVILTLTAGVAIADDQRNEEPGFFGRIWEGTKNIFGFTNDKDDKDRDEEKSKDKDHKKDKHDKKDKSSKKDHDDDDSDHDRDSHSSLLNQLFREDEKRILRDYYGSEHAKKQKSLPPGLKKKVDRGGELPPGWQKKMARGEVLPEDVYRYGQRLPDDIWRRLPRQPDGTSIIEIDGKAARVFDATRTIIDVLDL